MPAKTSILVCVVLGASLSIARADETENPVTSPTATNAPPAPAGEGIDQMVLPKGRLLLDAFAEINLSSGAVFKPFSITPDLWYGLTPDVTFGLFHSTLGTIGFMGGVGDSLCLTGTGTGGCPHVYNNVAFLLRYGLKKGTSPMAFDGGVVINSFDPFQLALKLGLSGRIEKGKVAFEFLPNILFGLTNREPAAGMGVVVVTNKEVLSIPLSVLYKATPKVALQLQTGAFIPLESTGDGYFIPLTIGGHYGVNESLNLTLAFSLPLLVGGNAFKPVMGVGADQTGFNSRTLTLGATYAF